MACLIHVGHPIYILRFLRLHRAGLMVSKISILCPQKERAVYSFRIFTNNGAARGKAILFRMPEL